MKAVDLLVKKTLPKDLQDEDLGSLDAKGIENLMRRIATTHPEDYARLSKEIGDIGRLAAYRQGATLSSADLRVPGLDRDALLARMDTQIAKLNPKDPEYDKKRTEIWQDTISQLQKQVTSKAISQGSNLAHTVLSGARGKPAQLRAMVATPGLYEDAKGRTIPLFVRHSFADGLRPAELLAGTYGARTAVISTKKNTAKGGDWGKQLAQAAASVVVTKDDCGTSNGIDLDPEDPSLRGRVLAVDTAGMPAGTILGKTELATLRRRGKKVLVRSVTTCENAEGVCAKCVGVHFDNKLPSIGDSVGGTAASALYEPVIQAGLNVKHQSGMSAGGKKEYAGLPYLTQFSQVPKAFKDRAALSEKDGVVETVEDAPQGGKYITVSGEKHYVLPGMGVSVAPGDAVERGDQLSEGFISPADVVRLQGLGAGRRYFAEGLKKVLDASGQPANLKNTELVARAVVNNVVVEDPEGVGDYLPDDSVSYDTLASRWVPPKSASLKKLDEAKGQYLHAPALHYTIGTRLGRRELKRLKGAGIPLVTASPEKPGFEPEMVRLRAATHGKNDWLAAQSTSYLKKQLLDAAYRGGDADVESSIHFAPRLAIGEDFGKNTHRTGKF